MFVEYALRRKADAISSVASTSALRITSKRIGSIVIRDRKLTAVLIKHWATHQRWK